MRTKVMPNDFQFEKTTLALRTDMLSNTKLVMNKGPKDDKVYVLQIVIHADHLQRIGYDSHQPAPFVNTEITYSCL